MYPVLSTLRRAAAAQILVRPDMLVEKEGSYALRTKTSTHSWDIRQNVWGPKTVEHAVFEILCRSESSEAAAISVSKREDVIAQKIQALNNFYTLVLGPEEEKEQDGQLVRTVRLAVLMGIYRASAKEADPQVANRIAQRQFKLPKGIVLSKN